MWTTKNFLFGLLVLHVVSHKVKRLRIVPTVRHATSELFNAFEVLVEYLAHVRYSVSVSGLRKWQKIDNDEDISLCTCVTKQLVHRRNHCISDWRALQNLNCNHCAGSNGGRDYRNCCALCFHKSSEHTARTSSRPYIKLRQAS